MADDLPPGAAPGAADPADPADPADLAAHCTSCGRPATVCPGCGRELDPPRYCGTCGTRLAVRVTPNGYAGRCKHHGEVAHS